MSKRSRIKEKFSALDYVLLVILIAYVVILAVLFYWAVITSFKSQEQFYYDKISLPTSHTYEQYKEYEPLINSKPTWNFVKFFREYKVKLQTSGDIYANAWQMLLNSLLYAVGCAFVNTLTQCLTAYVCSKFPCKLSKLIYGTAIVVMIIPIVGSLPAEVQLSKDLHLFDSILGQWVMKANFLGMYFLVFYATFQSLSNTYSEAGKIDGASSWDILAKISLPLVKNEFLTILLINFIGFWNDYQIPLLYLPSYPTMAYGIYQQSITFNEFTTVPMKMAGAVSMLVPVLVLFLVFHKRLMGNITVGGIKG